MVNAIFSDYHRLQMRIVQRELLVGFSINSEMSFMSLGGKPFSTLTILVTSFCRFL